MNKEVTLEIINLMLKLYGPMYVETVINILCFKKAELETRD